MSDAVFETEFEGLQLLKRGKVRDMYDLGDAFLMVASDRLSAFDVVMPDPIPDKGKILTQISKFWFDQMLPLIPNHIISCDVAEYPAACQPYADTLRDRSMLVESTFEYRYLPRGTFRVGLLRAKQWLSEWNSESQTSPAVQT